MNATASLIGATCDRTLTSLHGSVDIPDYWSEVLPLQKAIYNCCLALMNSNAADAEDALQDVLIHGSKKYPLYAGKIQNFSAWMLRVTKNFCISLIKKRSKHATGVDDIELVSALGAVDRDSAADTPVDWLLSDEESALIDEAIASLPDTLRGTYSLHFYEGLNPTQIADLQGITKVNVYQRISRALNILAPQLIGYFRSSSETTGSVQWTKASKSIGSVGSTTRTNFTGCTSPVKVLMDAVAAEKQPPDELLSQEIEPLNIDEEAHLSGKRPVQDSGPVTFSDSAWSCGELTEVAPPPAQFKIKNWKLKIGKVPENKERSLSGHSNVNARQLTSTDSDRSPESRNLALLSCHKSEGESLAGKWLMLSDILGNLITEIFPVRYSKLRTPNSELRTPNSLGPPRSEMHPEKEPEKLEAIPVLSREYAFRAPPQQRKTMASRGAKLPMGEVIQLASSSPELRMTVKNNTS